MHYLVTVGYELEQLDRNGNPRLQKVKYIVEAESVEEATIVVSKYKSGDMRSSESLSIAKMTIECIIDKNNTPEYYK
jgi:ssDNA-binding replication factor A large subunit